MNKRTIKLEQAGNGYKITSEDGSIDTSIFHTKFSGFHEFMEVLDPDAGISLSNYLAVIKNILESTEMPFFSKGEQAASDLDESGIMNFEINKILEQLEEGAKYEALPDSYFPVYEPCKNCGKHGKIRGRDENNDLWSTKIGSKQESAERIDYLFKEGKIDKAGKEKLIAETMGESGLPEKESNPFEGLDSLIDMFGGKGPFNMGSMFGFGPNVMVLHVKRSEKEEKVDGAAAN